MFPKPIPKHALLLQGPNGPFFRRYARDLQARGIRVTKINFSPSDSLFFRGDNAISYRGTLADWPDYFRDYVVGEEVDAVILFGDCRPIHIAITTTCQELNITTWVFEEGYIRPDYVTLERNGVNGNSQLPRDPNFYREITKSIQPQRKPPQSIGATFRYSALWAIINGWVNTLFGWRYPHYCHHRDIRPLVQGLVWIRGGLRKVYYQRKERSLVDRFTAEWSGNYFFVPLQVHNDSQVSHSDFTGVPEFIRYVVEQFATYITDNTDDDTENRIKTRLVFKHHPRDRPYCDYTDRLDKLASEFALDDRIVYVHDLHLPTLLKNARGTIVMNSTVGLSSLHHGTPVKALGKAVYNIPELTHQGDLIDFFRDPGVVDTELYEAFTSYIRMATQINGSFDKRLAHSETACGMKLAEAPDSDIANAREKAKRRAITKKRNV